MSKWGEVECRVFYYKPCYTGGRSGCKDGIDEREFAIMGKREHQHKSSDTDQNDKAHKNDFNVLRMRGKSFELSIIEIIGYQWLKKE